MHTRAASQSVSGSCPLVVAVSVCIWSSNTNSCPFRSLVCVRLRRAHESRASSVPEVLLTFSTILISVDFETPLRVHSPSVQERKRYFSAHRSAAASSVWLRAAPYGKFAPHFKTPCRSCELSHRLQGDGRRTATFPCAKNSLAGTLCLELFVNFGSFPCVCPHLSVLPAGQQEVDQFSSDQTAVSSSDNLTSYDD